MSMDPLSWAASTDSWELRSSWGAPGSGCLSEKGLPPAASSTCREATPPCRLDEAAGVRGQVKLPWAHLGEDQVAEDRNRGVGREGPHQPPPIWQLDSDTDTPLDRLRRQPGPGGIHHLLGTRPSRRRRRRWCRRRLLSQPM